MKKLYKGYKLFRNMVRHYLWSNVQHGLRIVAWNIDRSLSGPLDLSPLSECRSSIRYASKTEKSSKQYRRIMRKLLCFKGIGRIGPNKYWEYPWAITNAELSGLGRLKILDAGCGKAPVQYLLAELGHEVYGIDPREDVSWHGIDRSLAVRFGLNIEYRVEGIENISYEDNAFDRVFCLSVLEHCRAGSCDDLVRLQTDEDSRYQGLLMKQLARVLKPGGILLVTVDFNLPTPNFPLEANINCQNLIESNSLKICGEIEEGKLYGSQAFDIQKVLDDADVDIVDYKNTLQTSVGIKLKKPD